MCKLLYKNKWVIILFGYIMQVVLSPLRTENYSLSEPVYSSFYKHLLATFYVLVINEDLNPMNTKVYTFEYWWYVLIRIMYYMITPRLSSCLLVLCQRPSLCIQYVFKIVYMNYTHTQIMHLSSIKTWQVMTFTLYSVYFFE